MPVIVAVFLALFGLLAFIAVATIWWQPELLIPIYRAVRDAVGRPWGLIVVGVVLIAGVLIWRWAGTGIAYP